LLGAIWSDEESGMSNWKKLEASTLRSKSSNIPSSSPKESILADTGELLKIVAILVWLN
jgi:hypothetical protein